MDKIIEVCGIIEKEEILTSMEHKIIPNTCVLEDCVPFPGYYGDTPKKTQPCCIFIMMANDYSYEEIMQATNSIKTYFNQPFIASKADIRIYNSVFNAIRIRNIDNFDIIAELQKCYINENIKLRNKKVNVNAKALIKIQKTFKLQEKEAGYYLDLYEKEFGYFTISHAPSWKLFESQIRKLKNNWNNERFDSAIGKLFRFEGLQNIIRIYSENLSLNTLKNIKEQYIKYMSNH